MIGVDTNILVRLLTGDDRDQQERVTRWLRRMRTSGETVFVSVPVLCETVWVLTASYELPQAHVLEALESLLGTDVFQLEDEGAVVQAMQSWRSMGGDFADHFIGSRNLRAGCSTTLTFDRKAGKFVGFTLL